MHSPNGCRNLWMPKAIASSTDVTMRATENQKIALRARMHMSIPSCRPIVNGVIVGILCKTNLKEQPEPH